MQFFKVAIFCRASGIKQSKYCCHPPFHPPIFRRNSLKLLSPTLPISMNWILLSPPPLSADPDIPQNLERVLDGARDIQCTERDDYRHLIESIKFSYGCIISDLATTWSFIDLETIRANLNVNDLQLIIHTQIKSISTLGRDWISVSQKEDFNMSLRQGWPLSEFEVCFKSFVT